MPLMLDCYKQMRGLKLFPPPERHIWRKKYGLGMQMSSVQKLDPHDNFY